MLILHVSDTHLGAIPGNLLFRHRDILEAFRETIDIALHEHVDLYLHTGDFFDRYQPPADAYLVAVAQLKRLKEAGIKIVAIAGQHDLPKRLSVSPLELLKYLNVIDYVAINDILRIELEKDGRRYEVVAVPFSKRKEVVSVAPRLDRSILAAHLLLKELGIPNYDLSIHDLPKSFSYIALGDYHKAKMFRLSNGTPVVYAGATEVLKRDEYEEEGKHVVLIDMSGDEPRFEFIRLRSVRPWIIGEYNSVSQAIEDVLQKAMKIRAEGLKEPIVYLKLRSKNVNLQLLYRELEKLIERKIIAHYIGPEIESEPSTTKQFDVQKFEVEHIDLVSIVKNIVGDEKLAQLVIDLVQNPKDYNARRLVETLLSDEELLKLAERMFIAKTSLGTATTTSRTTTSTRSTVRKGDLTAFLGGR